MVTALFSLLALLAATPDAGARYEVAHGFPVMPGLKQICSEVVRSTDGAEVHYTVFVGSAPLKAVVDYYAGLLGTQPRVDPREQDAFNWHRAKAVGQLEGAMKVSTRKTAILCSDRIPQEASVVVDVSELSR